MQLTLTKHAPGRAITEQVMRQVVAATKKHIDIAHQYALSVVVVGDDEMQSLNEAHRGEDKVTDILSFTYSATEGELVICYPQVQRQADHKVQPIQRELAWLLVHGILHLHGYDHEKPEDAKIMRPLERTILCSIFDN